MDFRRFPTLIISVIAVLVQIGSTALVDLTPAQQGLISAAVLAASGVATAWLVKGDALVAAIVGAGQALLALGIGFGLELPAETQTMVLSTLTLLAGAFVHSQVTAPVPAREGSSPLVPAVERGRHAADTEPNDYRELLP